MFLLILVFLQCTPAFASLTDVYKQMEEYILKDQYESALDVFDDNDEYNLDKNERALTLKARALEGQNNLDDAIEI